MSFEVERGTISSLDSPSHLSFIALSSGGKFAHLNQSLGKHRVLTSMLAKRISYTQGANHEHIHVLTAYQKGEKAFGATKYMRNEPRATVRLRVCTKINEYFEATVMNCRNWSSGALRREKCVNPKRTKHGRCHQAARCYPRNPRYTCESCFI